MTTTKLNKRTLDILKNFSTFNQSIVFKPGNDIATLSITRKVLARATIEQKFDTTFAIYELTKFFGAISLFTEPTISVDKTFVHISDGKRSLKYITAVASDVIAPGEDAPNELPSVDVEFKLPERLLRDALKAASVLGQPDLVIEGNGESIIISTQNISVPTHESYSEDVGAFMGEVPFKFIIKVENMKLYPGDYTVRLCFQKIAQFVGSDVTYVIACEAASTVRK